MIRYDYIVFFVMFATLIRPLPSFNSHGDQLSWRISAPLGMMRESNVEADVITYNALMSCLGRTGLMAAGAGKHFEDFV